MSEYQVIARKYRPQRFDDVVGQDHVVATLRNAIRNNRTAHAYLFVGPRGVGKTTLARIFAKAMNCENPRDGEPCCECRSCRAIADESSIDVIEIDAAGHNSAAEMRELAEEVMHMPVAGRYKIYIIDEVHMLSNQAWNALLKTVEEPPAHVKFIFATTEVHKVLPTIISRCQRFDLMPIRVGVIAKRLGEIAAAENIAIDPGAVEAIARAADGGMRDAQSLLDQMFAFFSGGDNKSISASEVLSLFGLTGRAELDAIIEAMLTDHPAVVVSTVHALSGRGKNLETLFDDIVSALRAIQLCMLLDSPAEVLDDSPENLERYAKLGTLASRDCVGTLLETLAPVGRTLHDALNKQVFLETILLKAMREAHAVKIADLIARLNQLRGAGELQFLEQLPPPQKPAPPAPGARPEAKDFNSAPLQAAPLSAAVADSPDAAEEMELPSSLRLENFIEAARGKFPPKVIEILNCGSAGDFAGGVLTVSFPMSVSAADFSFFENHIPGLNELYRSLNSDWTSGIVFQRETSYEFSPDAAEPDEVAPEAVPEPVFETVNEPMDEEEAAVPQQSAPDVSGEEEDNAFSVMNDPGARESAMADPEVAKLLSMFGGRIADIHIDKKPKDK